MNPKDILHNNGSLDILIDSESFSQNINNNPNIQKILSYVDCEFFDLLRTPYNTCIFEIDKIQHFDNNIDDDRRSGGIEFRKEGRWAGSSAVTPILQNVEDIGKEVLHKDSLSEKEWEKIWYVFVHHALANSAQIFRNKSNIFVTEDAEILKNRNWFSEHFPGEPMMIVTTQEATEIMDLFAKNLGKYFLEPYGTANRGLWYWDYFRALVPHYHVPNSLETHPLDTLSSRFVFLLQSLDEMGMNHFKKIDNDSGDIIQYHFNYSIALITGIFDSLARAAQISYDINVDQQRGPSSISLSNRAGKYFLLELREHNPPLRDFIADNMTFINLIYELRENVLHRDFQRPVAIGTLTKTTMNLLKIPTTVIEFLIKLKDEKKKFDNYTKWGMHVIGRELYISPYEFGKTAATRLAKFIDEFLEKSGYELYVKENSGSRSIEDILRMKNKSLGNKLCN